MAVFPVEYLEEEGRQGKNEKIQKEIYHIVN